MIEPINQLKKRIETERSDSETSLFYALMFYGEAIFKLIILSFTASIKEDPSRSRYQIESSIVRSDGIGDWNQALLSIRKLNPLMNEEARLDFNEITQKCSFDGWQYKSIHLMRECVSVAIESNLAKDNGKESLLSWFDLFTQLRNKTRAHGAITLQKIERIINPLEESINIIIENLSILKREWAYFKRTLQGKYRVTKISDTDVNFSHLKTSKSRECREEYSEGIYIFWKKPIKLSLILPVDQNITDFYLPNGGWNNKTYELISYTTDSRQLASAEPYLRAVKDLPISETQAFGELGVIGNVFTNMPTKRNGYIKRSILEEELIKTLMLKDTRPIISLVGKGGIGKTWLTLEVLHTIALSDRYQSILWFSSRDVDLMDDGFKLVKPHLLSIEDVANEYSKLISYDCELQNQNKEQKITRLAEDLSHPDNSIGPCLFVFDNFETLEDPVSIYFWIEQHIRNPNKVIITTRNRSFKADFPIAVKGLELDEYQELINRLSIKNGYSLDQELIDKIYERSEGHPYIIRLVLSEIAASRKRNPDIILSGRLDVLEVLFERTFEILSSEAKRIFLTLSNWDSCVPLLALNAIMISNPAAPIDANSAVDELVNTSFIELIENPIDNCIYLSVPLVAMLFGKKKISTSSFLIDIKSDSNLLQRFGVIKETNIDYRFEYYFNRFLSSNSEYFSKHHAFENTIWAIIEYILLEQNELRLILCNFFNEVSESNNEYSGLILNQLKIFIQNSDNISMKSYAWKWIFRIQKLNIENFSGILNTIAAIVDTRGVDYELLSECANHMNWLRQKLNPVDLRLFEYTRDQMLNVLLARITEANSTDYSRIAWLLKSVGKDDEARDYARIGLELDKSNLYCARFLDGIRHW